MERLDAATAEQIRADADLLAQAKRLEMSEAELLALPVSVSLVTAARAFGLGRTTAHELARAGNFPCRVIRVANRYRVPRSALLEALGVKTLPSLTAGTDTPPSAA